MLSRTTPRANTARRGTRRPTTGNGLNRAAGFAYSHAMKLLNWALLSHFAIWLSLLSNTALVITLGTELRVD